MSIIDLNFQIKQARKGFRPPSAMKGIEYFLDFLGEFFGNFLGGFFLGGFFWEDFLGGFFGRNSLGVIT